MPLDFPSNPVDGQVYSNYAWSASSGAWKSIPSIRPTSTVSGTAPSSASSGDIWIDSNDGNSYYYYDDGTSKQWVELISSGIPATPVPVANGGTGASSAQLGLSNLGAAPKLQYGEYTIPTFSVSTSSTTYPTATPTLTNGSSEISSKIAPIPGGLTLQPGMWQFGISYTWGWFVSTARTFLICSFSGTDQRVSMPIEEVQAFSFPPRRISSATNLSFGFFQASGSSQNLTLYKIYATWLGPAN